MLHSSLIPTIEQNANHFTINSFSFTFFPVQVMGIKHFERKKNDIKTCKSLNKSITMHRVPLKKYH